MSIPTNNLIPLYLADNISLSQAVYSASNPPPPSNLNPNSNQKNLNLPLLSAVLKESKSLPRETDTFPTSPRPDKPGPAQEKLLLFLRHLRDYRDRDRSSGYGVGLDAGGTGDGDLDWDGWEGGENEEEEEEEEEYMLIRETIREAVPTTTTTTESSRVGGGDGRRRRRSSILRGTQKQFYNLISFLAFLTKDQLLLRPGVGERIISEMLRDTLSHSSHSRTSSNQSTSTNASKNRDSNPWFGDRGEASIAAVSLWMVIMGEELYSRISNQAGSTSTSTSTARNTSLSSMPAAQNGNRDEGMMREWEMYISRLQFLSLRGDLEISTRELAAEAAAVMGRVY